MAKNDGKESNDGCAQIVVGAIIVIVALIAAIPKPVWIAIGGFAAFALVTWLIFSAVDGATKRHAAAQEQARVDQAAQVAAAKRKREDQVRKRKALFIAKVGKENAALVERARSAANVVGATEAAREGWLGDVDFKPDIRAIIDRFSRALELKKVADQLSALDNASDDDRRILAEAKTTIAELEKSAFDSVELISKCATEAKHIDDSLHKEREDARTAEQRAELHGKLGAMLYGIETAPEAAPKNSAADAVMARVQAYREIKNQIQQAREA